MRYKKEYRPRPASGPWWRGELARRLAFFSFLGIVTVTGGGSRHDILSLVVLRPISFIAIGYAIAAATPGQIAQLRPLLWLLLAWAGIIAVQLIPLPFGVWTHLPGREMIANIDVALGLEGHWRTWSLAPSKTLNALLSLGTPFAVLLLFAIQPPQRIRHALLALCAMGAASIVLSLFQIAGPTQSPLYTYRITNHGSAVGIFANRNHNAVFLACLAPLAGYLVLARSRLRHDEGGRISSAVAVALVFLSIPTVLLSGSRAGTAALIVTLALTAILWTMHRRRGSNRSSQGASLARFAPLLGVGAVVVLTAVLIAFSRARSLERLFATSPADDLRFAVWPTLTELVATYFPFGSGFGSFYLVYQVAEPTEMLRPQYLNQAHNDPLQILIEGGLPAAVIAFLFLFWVGRAGVWAARSIMTARADSSSPISILPFAWISLATLIATSLIDYPLRTPVLMAVATILCCMIFVVMTRRRDAPGV